MRRAVRGALPRFAGAIRPVRRDDFARWLPLWDGYNAFYGRHGETALPREITRLTWERFFDPAEPVHAQVAENDGALIGLAHYLFHRTTTRAEPTCYLNDLFIRDDVRGRGVGRALILAVSVRAADAGCRCVYWQTHETNARAIRLYDRVAERSGFVVYRREV